MRTFRVISLACLAILAPSLAAANCPRGPPANNICTVVGTTVSCDLTTNGYAGSGNSNLTAVYDPALGVCSTSVCIWGSDTSGTAFCVEYNPAMTETLFEVRGGSNVDDIRFSYGIFDLDNFAGTTLLGARVSAGGGSDVIYGSRSTATGFHDELHGDDGADTIYGQAGGDDITGDAGTDTIDGGAGNDYIHGGSGNDNITGGTEDDTIDGDDHDDVIDGDAGNDTIRGGIGMDSITGGADNDTISGGGHDDLISGNDGNDTIHGDGEDDVICGDDGTDTLTGDDGNDRLWYGSALVGAETINGFIGTDTCQDHGTNPPTSNCEVLDNTLPASCP